MQPSLAVIVLNYKRPQNIGRIVRGARAGLPGAQILIFDNASQDGLHARDDIPWGEAWLHRSAANCGSGARIALAASLPFDHYIAVDDDIFLTPGQYAALADRLQREPDRAHGICGQRLELRDGVIGYRHRLVAIDAGVSILNMAYAFTRAQASAAMALAARVGFADWRAIGSVDDIVLSCASAKPSFCHDLGALDLCPSGNDPTIAQWLAGDFGPRRAEVVGKLLAIQSIPVFSPLTVAPG
jgi:hypothetical protein